MNKNSSPATRRLHLCPPVEDVATKQMPRVHTRSDSWFEEIVVPFGSETTTSEQPQHA